MKLRSVWMFWTLTSCAAGALYGASDIQTMEFSNAVAIPGGNLAAGTYTFAIEDRLEDRAIIRISQSGSSTAFLLLGVPNGAHFIADSTGLSYFTSVKDGSKSLQSWKCSDCTSSLEFVYPKLEAVAITSNSAESALAVDPAYDKLPPNLSADDMKVVTLWLLSPKRITNRRGEGVNAEKYVEIRKSAQSQPAQTAELASTALAPTPERRRQMPRTASSAFTYALYGLLLLSGAMSLRLWRVRQN